MTHSLELIYPRTVEAMQYDGRNGSDIKEWLEKSTGHLALVAHKPNTAEILINDGENRLLHVLVGDWIIWETQSVGNLPEVWVMTNEEKEFHFKEHENDKALLHETES